MNACFCLNNEFFSVNSSFFSLNLCSINGVNFNFNKVQEKVYTHSIREKKLNKYAEKKFQFKLLENEWKTSWKGLREKF